MQKYLLLLDQDADILELQEATLKYFYGGEIVTVRSRDEAVKSLLRLGRPEIIISDLQLLKNGFHHYLKESGSFLPLVATSFSRERQVTPAELTLVTSFLTKPINPEDLSHLVKSFTQAPPTSPTHVPIKHKVACEVASGLFDIYLKLSGTNFVKIINKGSEFTLQEAMKLSSKGINEVYIKASESREFLKVWEESLSFRMGKKPEALDAITATDCLEQVERITRAFGWSSDAVKASQKIVKDAIRALTKDERMANLLKRKFAESGSHYSRHVGLLCYLSCVLCAQVKKPEAQEKLVMAALMHDLAVDESLYPQMDLWNKQASRLEDRSPEVVRYRLHALHASQTAQTIEFLPPDVDQIILQHHEAPDGSGFPRGLSAHRIHYLAAMFIIAEDLVHFLDDGENLETSMSDFLTWGEHRYSQGNFKKIFEEIRPRIA